MDLLVEGPALYPGHDVLVPPLRVRVPRPARGEHVAVRGELEYSSKNILIAIFIIMPLNDIT